MTTGSSPHTPWQVRALVYLLVALAMTWPLGANLTTASMGFPNVDGQDTVMLRGLVAELMTHPWDLPHSALIYFPAGFPVLHLTPNLLDHLTGGLIAWLLPFPLADNLWWLGVLSLNGLCAHRLGRRLGGSEGAGWMVGVGFMLCEAVAREANLHHAPQAMVFWAPLYLDALLGLREAPTRRRAALAGLWLAGAGISYWYLGLFLGLAGLPLLLRQRWSDQAVIVGVAALVSAPFLAPFLLSWGEVAVTAATPPPPTTDAPSSFSQLPQELQFIALHGNDPLFWWRSTPLDTSNLVSVVLIVAAAWGAGRMGWRKALPWVWVSGLGAAMLLGPYLRLGDEIVVVGQSGISLPFRWLGELHPVFARLTWPERWGVLVPLGLLALASRAPRPALVGALIAAECVLRSGNLPVQHTSLRFERCWAHLDHATGALIELPLKRGGLRAPRVGVHQRFHRRPVVNPVLLPPGATMPEAWEPWVQAQPMMRFLKAFEDGEAADAPGADAVIALREAGVSAITADVEPGGVTTAGGVNRYRAVLGRHLGPPIDLGCALVWWLDDEAAPPVGLDDGDAWRVEAAAWKEAHPVPELDTLMQATWDAVQRRGG